LQQQKRKASKAAAGQVEHKGVAGSGKQHTETAAGAAGSQHQGQAGFNPEKPFAALFPSSGSKPTAA
jgi:hypothetical protein